MMRLFVLFSLIMAGLVGAGAAQSTAALRVAQRQRRAPLATPATPPASSMSRRPAIVVLSAAPVVEHLMGDASALRARMFSREGDDYAQSLRQAKAPLVAQLGARGAMVFAQTEHVLNAIMVDATAEDLAWLRQQPGVQSAEFSEVRHADLNTATTLIGAPAVWTQLGGSGNAGHGQMIAVLDSGIDSTIPMFSGSGFTAPSGFPKTNASAGSSFTRSEE